MSSWLVLAGTFGVLYGAEWLEGWIRRRRVTREESQVLNAKPASMALPQKTRFERGQEA